MGITAFFRGRKAPITWLFYKFERPLYDRESYSVRQNRYRQFEKVFCNIYGITNVDVEDASLDIRFDPVLITEDAVDQLVNDFIMFVVANDSLDVLVSVSMAELNMTLGAAKAAQRRIVLLSDSDLKRLGPNQKRVKRSAITAAKYH